MIDSELIDGEPARKGGLLGGYEREIPTGHLVNGDITYLAGKSESCLPFAPTLSLDKRDSDYVGTMDGVVALNKLLLPKGRWWFRRGFATAYNKVARAA